MSSRGRVLGRCCYLRLPRYGANLADSAHDSPAYCRRLEKYERRGFIIAVPGNPFFLSECTSSFTRRCALV